MDQPEDAGARVAADTLTGDAEPTFTPIACPVCGSRSYDPVATGQRRYPPGDGDPSFLMVECAVCSLLYLNPVPTFDGRRLDEDPWLPPARPGEPGNDDIVVVTPNADSWSRRIFGRRHWSSYDFPNRRLIFGRASLGRLARERGYGVVASRTLSDRQVWTDSLGNFLADWEVSPFWIRVGRGLVARAVAGIVETAGRMAGRGSLLEVRLRSSPGEKVESAPPERGAPALGGRSPTPVAILGAGVAGLTAAVELRRRDIPAVVFEAGSRIAGLAQSYRDDEGFSHDFGAHFITNRFAAALGLGSRCRTVRRFGEAVRLRDETYGYPFGLMRTPRFAAGAVREKLRPRGSPVESAADFYRREFGAALAEEVAIPLIEAWSGAAAEELAPTVSPPQLDRGISHVLGLKLASRWSGRAVANGFSRAQPENAHVFHVYPRQGLGVITGRLASEVEGTIEVNSPVEAIYVEEGRVRGVRVAGVDLDATTVISTAPVHVLPKLIRGTDVLQPLSKFRYRAFALVNLRFDTRPVLPEVCTWIPERHYSFFRLTEAPLAMPWLAPEGKTVVTADIGCSVGDDFWTMDEGALGEHCVEQLEELFPGVRRHYLGSHVLRTAVAHPVYLAAYEDDRLAFGRGVPIEGLHSIGRNGEFAHILMEDVYWLTRSRIARVFD